MLDAESKLLEQYVNTHFEQSQSARLTRFNDIIELVSANFPQATMTLEYKMPTFRLGDNWLAVGNQKNYCSVYTCMAEHLAGFKKKYPRIKTGKGCINLKDKDIFELNDLVPVIKSALTHNKNT